MMIFQQRFPEVSGHTTQNTNQNRFAITILSDGMNPVVHLAISILPHRAGIEHYHIRIRFLFHKIVICFCQNRSHQLGVVLIHLAAISLYINFFHVI